MGCSPSVALESAKVRDQSKVGVQKTFSWSDPVTLTDAQKKLVAKSMYHLRPKLSDLGLQVYLNVFSKCPQLKDPFGFKDKSNEELEYDLEFRGHAARFMAVVGCAIESLHKNDGQTEQLIREVGARHLNIHGFQTSNFSVFNEALLQCMGKQMGGMDRFKGDLYAAWDAVVKYIIQRLQEGYMDAKSKCNQDVQNVSHNAPDTVGSECTDPRKQKSPVTSSTAGRHYLEIPVDKKLSL